MALRIDHHRSLDSTQHHARRLVMSGAPAEVIAVVADEQTGAVGRLGRAWSAPAGGAWFTLIVPMERVRPGTGVLSIAIALACLGVVDDVLGDTRATLKWPNDVLANGRKLAGILCEIVHAPGGERVLLAGVGCNVNNPRRSLSADAAARATSIVDELGREADLVRVRKDLIDAALSACISDADAALIAQATARLHALREPTTVRLPGGETTTGTIAGLGSAGELLLNLPGGAARSISTGEVGS